MITLCKQNTAVIQPMERLDSHNGATLVQTLREICPQQHNCWVIDLSDVEFVDSAGLSALIHGLNLACENQCRLAVCNLHPAVKLVFEITRMDEIFDVVDTIESTKDLTFDLDRDNVRAIARAA